MAAAGEWDELLNSSPKVRRNTGGTEASAGRLTMYVPEGIGAIISAPRSSSVLEVEVGKGEAIPQAYDVTPGLPLYHRDG